jgi:hypothetical protein
MSLGIRSFVEFVVKKIEKEGVLGQDYSSEERTQDVIDMIWQAYDDYENK